MHESLDISHMDMESQVHGSLRIYYYEKLTYAIMEAESVQDLQSTSDMARRASDAVPSWV